MLRLKLVGVLASLGVVATACPPPPPPPDALPNPLTLGSDDALGNAAAWNTTITPDGVWTAFGSTASNLVPGDSPGTMDLFLRNRSDGTVERIVEGGHSPRISPDGAYISYQIGLPATELGVYDRVAGTSTEWTGVGNGAWYEPVVSASGDVAVYGAVVALDGAPELTCRVRDLLAETETDCPTPGGLTGDVALKGISANSRFVAYYFDNDGPEEGPYIWDRDTDSIESLLSDMVAVPWAQPVQISDNGRFIAHATHPPDAVTISVPWLHDRVALTIQTLPVTPNDHSYVRSISQDGRYVSFQTFATNLDPGDTSFERMYIWDSITNDVELASKTLVGGFSLSSGGHSCAPWGPGQITDDGGVCVTTPDAMIDFDTNDVFDSYLASPLG